MLSKLDAYRQPADQALTPPKATGGVLRISALATWVVYVAVASVEYANTPDVVSIAVVPSAMFLNNYLNFEFVDPDIESGPSYFYGKYDNLAPCDNIAAYADVDKPTPLCPRVLGAAGCGVDADGKDVLFPQGVAYFYSITNQSIIDDFFEYSFAVMFKLSAPNSDITQGESWIDGVPVDQQMPEAKPGQLVLAAAEVLASIKHTVYPSGKNSTKLMGTNVNVKWVTIDLTKDIVWPKCVKNVNATYDVDTGDVSLFLKYPNGTVTELKNQTSRNSFMGLGVVILTTSDTTVIETIKDGRPGVFAFLGSLGGAFGFLMAVSRILYRVLDAVSKLQICECLTRIGLKSTGKSASMKSPKSIQVLTAKVFVVDEEPEGHGRTTGTSEVHNHRDVV